MNPVTNRTKVPMFYTDIVLCESVRLYYIFCALSGGLSVCDQLDTTHSSTTN